MNAPAQKGVAIVTALLLTALAVTIVAGLFWQQQVQLRLVENQRVRVQEEWLMRDMLDWGRAILVEDDRRSAVDDESETWAQPLTATPLIDAYGVGAIGLNGRIVDAQSRFNLANLSDAGRIDPIETSIFARLLTLLRIDPALANAAAESLAALQRTDTGDVDTIRMRLWQLDDLLTIPGYTPAIVAKLRELVVILPRATPVNLNTAPPEVFAALFPSMQLPMAISLVEQRRRTYYRDAADFAQRLSAYGLPVPSGSTAFASQFFLLRSQVSIQDAVLQRQSLIERANGQARVLWSREEEPSWQP